MTAHHFPDHHSAAEPSDGRQQVNRPFYAIGVLLAFLALAMLAVGLSSRPRPLAPQGTGPSAAGSGTQTPRHQPGPTAYVLIVPDAPVETTNTTAVLEQPTYEQGCGWDRGTGLVYVPTPEPAIELRGIRVEIARDPSQWADPRGELTTGYDSDYDRAMNPAPVPQTAPIVSGFDDSGDDDLVRRFQSFLPRSAASTAPVGRRHWEYQIRTIYLGVTNRLGRFMNPTVASDSLQPGPSWSDYEAWIESQQAAVAGLNTPVRASAVWGQPKDQVLQIAVSALNRVAEMLHAAVLRLMDQATERLAQRTSEPAVTVSPK
jgi:hypothetical protein